jgi:tripartite-type tricarboxylate transporter receptor subunit TctC
MIRRSVVILAAAAASLTLGAAPPAGAETYPSRPIEMIVPLAPGGSTDVLGRIMAQAMSKALGQPVVVENVAGAAGTIGVTRAPNARPRTATRCCGACGERTWRTAPSTISASIC